MKAIPTISYALANTWTVNQLEQIASAHILWSLANGRYAGTPKVWTADGYLNVLGVRNNHEHGFNNGSYNDLLICWKDGKKEVFLVTCDPGTKKDGRAHLRQGAWNSYVVRPHQWGSLDYTPYGPTRQRWALCQDKAQVQVLRTDGQGNIKGSEAGRFGINIHDCYRQGSDTSIGCTVIKNMKAYVEYYVPLLVDAKNRHLLQNKDNITYLLINSDQLHTYLD